MMAIGAHAQHQAGPCPITAEVSAEGDAQSSITFAAWLDDLREAAVRCGISAETLDAALAGLVHDEKVARLDRRQAEYNSTFSGYLRNRVSDTLVAAGRDRLAQWRPLLDRLEQEHGVPAEVLVALWALESAFGQFTGDTPTIQALATLAHDGRRKDFYQRELLAALRIIDAEHIAPRQMRGSWAGAMGQPQFMPSTFLAHARDGDGDGRVDIWDSVPDALASAANYLASIRWRRGQPWGREVRLPPDFDAYQARMSLTRSDRDWIHAGVRAADGGPLRDLGLSGSIVLPSGIDGPAFLVYDNFHIITEWNRSLFYALTVGILAERLAGGEGLVGRAALDERRLSRELVMALQSGLNRVGYDAGTPDGMVGMQTRQALRDFQRDQGLTPDAYPDDATIARVRQASALSESASDGDDVMTRGHIVAIQRGLNAAGYSAGMADGIWGRRTGRAFDAWLRDQGLPMDTRPTPALISRLVASSADMRSGRVDPVR
jgi:membrane-bound lytic murein transglycosylase B